MSNNSSFLTIKLWDKSILPSSNILSDEGVSLWIFRYITPFNKRNYNGTPSLLGIDKHNALVYNLFD